MGKKKKQKQGRPVITDVSAVRMGTTPDYEYVTSRAYAETADLLSEGEIDGLVSGNYQYMGNEGETGYTQVTLDLFLATGKQGAVTSELQNDAQQLQLGFLRSIYWNDVPVVDKDGYYNFQSVNVHQVVGGPIGTLPTLSTDMNNYTGMTGDPLLDLSVQRGIGERLYGPEVASGDGEFPTDERSAKLKAGTRIDKYSKTYTILNKECSKIQVNIKINALFESLQAGPKTYKKSSELAAQGAASAGYGDTKARTIEYAIYYQPIFDQRFQPASLGKTVDIVLDKTVLSPQQWIGPITERVTGKIDQGYIRTTTIDLSKEDLADTAFFEGWRIRIVRLTPESLTSFLRNVSFVDSIVEVYGTQLRYPYSSMIYSQFDARTFSRIPSRAYDTRLLKIKVPNNYDPETKTYGRSDGTVGDDPVSPYNTLCRRRTGSNPWYFNTRAGSEKTQAFWLKAVCATRPNNNWNGEFKKETFSATAIGSDSGAEESKEEIFIKEWCDNPAWCFYDILTNPRYGLGEYIKEDDIDKWALYEIAQYCDVLVPDGYGGIEPRFTFNYMISSREEAFKVVNDLASAFRGIAYYANGSIMAVQDKFKNPITQFTTSNVVNGDFNYASSAKKARHTVAIVRYNDKRNFFQPAVEYVEDEESVRRYGIREIETSALGCTSKGQARRFAKWILASEANETETVSFGVGMEGAYLKPGDIVQIYDNFRSPLKYSGRTNRVEPLVPNTNDANNADWQEDDTVEPVFGSNFDNIIVDQAISFKTDKLYKLDLLTPTYDYPTGTVDLDSSNKTSRNQLQTVFFSGAHTKTYTGSLAGGDTFRSDYLVSGSGVCTQIFFNTGGYFGGTANQLDFTNYVITGYTNDDVQGKYTADSVSESYSGGCFSGQNLIWSCEPSAINDDEFVSGNSSDYRIINVAENDNSSYSVSALAYSTGKYDDVENAIKFEGKNVSKIPMFPTGHIATRQAEINRVKPLYFPYAEPKPNRAATSTALKLDIDYAWPSGYSAEKDVPELDKYLTLKVTFLPAGYESAQINTNQTISTDTVADETLDYAICISREANFNLPQDASKVDNSNRLPFAVNHGNWRVYETGVELFIPGKTAGSTSKYGKYEVKKDSEGNITDAKIIDYTAEFLIYEPNIEDYHVAVFALSKEGAISDGILSKIKIDALKEKAQSFSIANAISISQLTTENIVPVSSTKTTMHPIDSMEPTFGWNTSFTSIMNEVTDPDHPVMGEFDDPYYELTPAQNLTDYRITIRKPSNPDSVNIPNSKIYVEFTGFTPAALSPDFAFKSTYNDPNVVTGLRAQAVTGVPPLGESGPVGVGDVGIWDGEIPHNQVTNQAILNNIKAGNVSNRDFFIRNDPSGYIVTNNDEDFPLREYDIVVEAHDQYGKTSSRNEVWANTIGNNESESNWAGSTTKYDIMGVSIEPPSGLIFASAGTFDNNPFTTDWLQPYEAYTQNYPYVAQTAMYPNGFLDITLQHSEGAGADAGKTVSTDEELEKYFNNVAGLIYYYTTGDNAMTFNDGGDIQTPTKAAAFQVDLKAQDPPVPPSTASTYKVDSTHNTNAGFIGTKANKFFGGVLSSEGLLATVDVDYEIQRGYYLLNESDTLENLRLPLPKISNPNVENIQLVVGFFDELSLLRGFEADGKTAKLVGENSGTNKETPKIFTDRDINMSTIPVDFAEPLNIVGADGKINKSLAPVGTSLYMGESSIMGAGDTALAFRGWCELGILSKGLTPVRVLREEEKTSWSYSSTLSSSFINVVEWVDLEINKPGYPVESEYSYDLPVGEPLPAALLQENCVFKNVNLGQDISARYKVSQPKMGNNSYATQIWIQIRLNQALFKGISTEKIAVFAEIDGGIGIHTSTRVDKPEGDATGDIVINYYMDKLRGSTTKRGRGMMLVSGQRRYEMNTWVPQYIKVRFGILATNQ